jgi:hypothetical protein
VELVLLKLVFSMHVARCSLACCCRSKFALYGYRECRGKAIATAREMYQCAGLARPTVDLSSICFINECGALQPRLLLLFEVCYS